MSKKSQRNKCPDIRPWVEGHQEDAESPDPLWKGELSEDEIIKALVALSDIRPA